MAKIIDFNTYRVRFTGKAITKPKYERFKNKNVETLYVEIRLNYSQLMMLKRILESEIDAHERRQDYTLVIAHGLKTINFEKAASKKKLNLHVYEIYYYKRIIEFYIESYDELFTELDKFLIYELHDIFSEYERENEELIDEFSYKDPEEKYKIVRKMIR